ncbi:P-loop containing nucleoside triphosphate hydrolase protein [Neolentinus lepideus HHB14362 ss-1]|uniref:DNA repair protein RAD50 n=1 Tax=Neolentinus lepideus HHB14362 ss-1 TaxID=1314782 RepID=A0A165R7T7_9AGAM|nr:P-loop containing nucleoside triphosphate hydrolase protein [Neolentinus lepideus HHB14362 ss-1]
MASLNKLAIRGIRSFDDKQISVIEFFTPVTVIVGPNGSGKTTVIECLKYATTGDQPPNTRGGAFVHDPKMANEKEVKAQVKLRFNAANGARMLAVRNLSVTMKKNNTMTMKTLESILALADSGAEKGGKRGVISTKCAEIDTEIPHLLGVSKAVLENVIFCHQEDSYWPLAEPSILKKKFDDIFEATRYTKALDAIKALRKDRVAELKAEKERLESLSKEKVHADKLKSRISDLTAAIASKEIEYDQTKKGYEQLVLANKKFYDYATQFRELYLKIQNMEQNRDRYKTELESAKENVREVEGTEEELQARLDTFADHIAQQKERAKQEEIKRQDYEEELAAARKAHVQLINQQGSLEAEKRAQEQRLAEREELIRDLSTKYQIKGYDYSPLEKEKAAEFTSRLSDLLRRETIDAEKIQDEVNAKNKEYQERSRQLHADLERLKQMKSSLRNQISTLQTNIARNESQLDASQTINAELRNLATDMEERKARLEKVKAEIKSSNYDERIAEKTAKIRSMEEQKDALNQDLRSLSLQADMRARLDIKRAEQKSKAAEVRNMY